ncbi:hypothetical protein BAY61_09700 [Prauserella marina]|uniref:Uncharacterized protein n=1 Tax=Prauserella marina TaxID=530584 RepID=A0A222VMU1_9PSEU|nr:DUF3558 family protein [Prauserella marina]ASR35217.1 hypothetical protein BAY61_09700 [Prauserella marina]PWV85015.1 uncharacterized protein DUF3558 [Prauserella marina]SDC06805.1 Protein of unknown function [Prauserella marina]
MRVKAAVARGVLACVAVLTLSSCASAVGGVARPVAEPTTENRATAGEPCELLTGDETTALGMVAEGEFEAGRPEQLMPPTCTWPRIDIMDGIDSLTAGYAVGYSVVEYVDGEMPAESVELGGLTWERYLDAIGGESICMLVTEVDVTSFVVLISSDWLDESKACDIAKLSAPYVAAKLPGGQPAPPLPSPEAPPAPSVLTTTDPCTLLTPEQTGELGLDATAEPQISSTDDIPDGCRWLDTDGEGGVHPMGVFAGDRPADEWPFTSEPGEPVEADGRTWDLYPAAGDIATNCEAVLAFSDTASVKLVGGHEDEKKVCDVVKAAIPMVTANLPEA